MTFAVYAGMSGRRPAAWLLVSDQLRDGEEACPASGMDRQYHCAVDGFPLETTAPR
ncbi:hypothetical protein BH23ACT2_BH23ACT2_27570 [soil metagenome]